MVSIQPKNRFFAHVMIIVIAMLLGVSCNGNQDVEEVNAPAVPATPTIVQTLAPDRVVLTAAENISEAQITEASAYIAQLAAESGLAFEMRDTVFSNEITPDVKIIIFLEQPDNLGSLAASAPQTQFVAIGNKEWNPPANGNIIMKNDDHIAFLAGYLSAMLAPNFRVGALQVAEDTLFNQAFNNGVSYFCGSCAPSIYPINLYPVVAQIPLNNLPANWQAAFDEINASKVNVLFLPSGAASPELGAYLASQDIAVIGNSAPPEELRSKWVATIASDGLSPLREMWPDLLAGTGGKTINASLKISDVNYINVADGLVWLSQGKMNQFNEIIQLIREGQIYPYKVN